MLATKIYFIDTSDEHAKAVPVLHDFRLFTLMDFFLNITFFFIYFIQREQEKRKNLFKKNYLHHGNQYLLYMPHYRQSYVLLC